MTDLRIKQVKNGAGDVLPATVSITLIDADGLQRIGWQVSTGQQVTEYQGESLRLADLVVPLTPQDDIAIDASGSGTYYLVQLLADRRTESYTVQVPDSGITQELMDLVGAAAIEPGSILAGRLLPATADEGSFLIFSGGAWIATDTITI